MVAHSSILAWGIPWTEEPGRLQSMGSQRVGHDPDTSSKATLWMKALHEGALATLFIVRKNPQDPHTAPQLACHPLNNERGKQSPLPHQISKALLASGHVLGSAGPCSGLRVASAVSLWCSLGEQQGPSCFQRLPGVASRFPRRIGGLGYPHLPVPSPTAAHYGLPVLAASPGG